MSNYVYSENYAHEGDETVIQCLVFEKEKDFDNFKLDFPDYNTCESVYKRFLYGDNCLGAKYKIRAVCCDNKNWYTIIRRADVKNGIKLGEFGPYNSPEEAIEMGKKFIET